MTDLCRIVAALAEEEEPALRKEHGKGMRGEGGKDGLLRQGKGCCIWRWRAGG